MIECKNLVKTYINGDVETNALNGVSFGIKKGEFVSIIGPSGSGKSTLMHILGALDTPTSGEYFIDGHEVSRLNDDELSELRKNKIGFSFSVFQSASQDHSAKKCYAPTPLFRCKQGRKRKESQGMSELCRHGRKQVYESFQPAFWRTNAKSRHSPSAYQ